MQEFICNAVTLDYLSVAALTTTRDFSGKVGTQDISIEIQPGGIKITGKLELPISPASRISSTGT
ncbi:hypothetical protein NW756_014538 [Fusarium oxysporum]|nr:hypothetical protein NW753_014458 [Fusarium oxysporum]KAJ4029692.1 hypothetical protein NW763_014878 [Fusarium oxysporum]KAJ4072686.1 hypothetical protein NW756_014538 [Fusarium oxysporum]